MWGGLPPTGKDEGHSGKRNLYRQRPQSLKQHGVLGTNKLQDLVGCWRNQNSRGLNM